MDIKYKSFDMTSTTSTELVNAINDYSLKLDSKKLIEVAIKYNMIGSQNQHLILLLMKILENEDPNLQSSLGNRYYLGNCVKMDKVKALDFYKNAESRGSILSKFYLGWHYYQLSEYHRAIEYFGKCIIERDKFDDFRLGECYACLGDSYTRIAEPKFTQAFENLTIAADIYHDTFACRRLGKLYSKRGTSFFNPEKVLFFYERGAELGDDTSACELGECYIFGNEELNVKKNWRKAEKVLLPYSDGKNSDILRLLGILYLNGSQTEGVIEDLDKAKKYLSSAWDLSRNKVVASELGYAYYRLGEYKKCEELLLFADAENCCHNSDFLARMYKDGHLGSVDLKKAEYYYERSYKAGNLNNVFTCVEYSEFLDQLGKYERSFDVADYGENEFKDICFVFIKANLVLTGKIKDKMPMDDALIMMEVCIERDNNKKEAHFSIANYHYQTRNYRLAEFHYLEAFKHGLADAGAMLGKLYEFGGGSIQPNVNKAFEWYTKSAAVGSAIGQEEAACFEYVRKGVLGKNSVLERVRNSR